MTDSEPAFIRATPMTGSRQYVVDWRSLQNSPIWNGEEIDFPEGALRPTRPMRFGFQIEELEPASLEELEQLLAIHGRSLTLRQMNIAQSALQTIRESQGRPAPDSVGWGDWHETACPYGVSPALNCANDRSYVCNLCGWYPSEETSWNMWQNNCKQFDTEPYAGARPFWL